jgi:hypothetical protein
MQLSNELQAIDGARELYEWFGHWPGFHDAEIIRLHLNRRGSSSLVIHTWEMTKELDEKGYYVPTKHVVVEFTLEGISELDLEGSSTQNVIFGLNIEKTETGFRMTLDPCYGLAGTIEATRIVVRLTPGKPSD